MTKKEIEKLKSLEKKDQLQFLVNLAFEEGLKKAVGAAKILNNAYILDEFHDLIVDRLYNELKKRGKIK